MFAGGVLALSLIRIRRVVAAVRAGIASGTLRSGLLLFVFFYVLIYALTRPPAADVFLPPAWSGNRDLLTHIRYAKHLLMFGSPDLDAASFDYLRSPAVSHLLAGFSLAFNQDPLERGNAGSVCAGRSHRGRGSEHSAGRSFRLPSLTAIIIACIFITNPYFKRHRQRVSASTLTAIPILLFLLWLTVRSPLATARSTGRLLPF